jgi:hypothetical protein
MMGAADAQDRADPREESLRAGDRQHALGRTLLIRAPFVPEILRYRGGTKDKPRPRPGVVS